jgi:hypothetical protein
MKKHLLLFVALLAIKAVSAQTLTISGSVKDDDGNTVPLAFVQDKSDKTATRTDSLGKFTLKANPNSTLFITSTGYEPKVIDVKGKTDLTVVLKTEKAAVEGTGTGNADKTGASGLTSYNGTGTALLYGHEGLSSMSIPSFHQLDATKGSRYMFNDWVKGFVVSPKDSVYKNANYGFNYDKMGGGLLLTQDKHSAIEISPSEIKSFTVYNEQDQPMVFEYVPEINKSHFPQVLATGKNYKIYKMVNTKFVKSDFHTDGMTSSGNNYDEFVDVPAYYVYNVQTKQLQPFTLKKKSIKLAFSADGKKVDSFFDAYTDDISDSYLRSLGDYMNQ